MKRVAVVQARMKSSRLPGKTLLTAAGKPLLQHLLERLGRAKNVDQAIVATTTNPEDDAVETLCRRLGAGCFRGSSEDMFARVLGALNAVGADLHVEIHGDGPLLDWRVVDQAVDIFSARAYDLVTNGLVVTYPPGLEVWVYKAGLLRETDEKARAAKYRAVPALYILEHAELFRTHNFEAPPALHAPDVYLEIDAPPDWEVLREIFENLYPANPAFLTEDVLRWMKARPELAGKNRDVERLWKKSPFGASG